MYIPSSDDILNHTLAGISLHCDLGHDLVPPGFEVELAADRSAVPVISRTHAAELLLSVLVL